MEKRSLNKQHEGARKENHGPSKSIRVRMEKTWSASYPLLAQKAFLPLTGWILLSMKGHIHNVKRPQQLVLSLCTSFKELQNQHGVHDKKNWSE